MDSRTPTPLEELFLISYSHLHVNGTIHGLRVAHTLLGGPVMHFTMKRGEANMLNIESTGRALSALTTCLHENGGLRLILYFLHILVAALQLRPSEITVVSVHSVQAGLAKIGHSSLLDLHSCALRPVMILLWLRYSSLASLFGIFVLDI